MKSLENCNFLYKTAMEVWNGNLSFQVGLEHHWVKVISSPEMPFTTLWNRLMKLVRSHSWLIT